MNAALRLVVSLCLAATLAVAQEAPEIIVSVDRTAEVGQAVTVIVQVSGAQGADCDLLDLPELDGARLDMLSNPSSVQRKSVVNGRVTTSFTTQWKLQLVPERTGRIDIPALRFSCRGAEAFSDPTFLDVSESSLPTDTVRLAIKPSVDVLWVGQVFDVVIEAGVLRDQWANVMRGGLQLSLPWQLDEDLVLLLGASPTTRSPSSVLLNGRTQQIDMSNSEELRDGKIYHLLTRRLQFLAREPGMLDLRDSRFSAQVATEIKAVRDPLSIFGRTQRQATQSAVLDAYALAEPVEIRPLPVVGRPASFRNAVGDFRFFVDATPRDLTVGETCRLTIEVRGAGNLEFLEWPEFSELDDDFRVFDKNEEKGATYQRLTWDIAPLNDRVDAVPSLRFSHFDPNDGEYVEVESPAIPLDVSPGGDGGLTDLEPTQAILHDLETIRDALPPAAPEPWPTWWLWAPAALALVATEAFVRRAAWRANNPAAVARRGARGRLEAELRDANDAGAAAGAFARYLSARLDGPPAGLSAREAGDRLRDADAALADELVATVKRWEAGYLGGASIDASVVVDEARALADRVEAAR